MGELRGNELEDAEFAFQIYQNDDKKLDATLLGNYLRAMNLNPSLDSLEKLGAAKKAGEKFFTLDDVKGLYQQCKKDIKEQGCYEDFVECLKLYDKNENGRMLSAELSNSLLCLGEKLTDPQVEELFADCLPEEDDEGEIEYDIFLRKMCGKPPK